jgi:adenylosuccinate synthase
MEPKPKGNAVIVVGGKWGDEGKGKITSRFSKDADLVIRGTGGANAGHTIVYNGKKIALHLVPGGIVYPQTTCLIGQGVVIDVPILLKEIEELEEIGVPYVRKRLKISGRAHIVFPYHKDLDALYEKFKDNPVGTTKRGIGPAYMDQDCRTGIRLYDLLMPEEELERLIKEAVKPHNQLFLVNSEDEPDKCYVIPKALAKEYHEYGKILQPMLVKNPDGLTSKAYREGKKVVVEGAQAYRLDKFYGDYPDVTSSNCVTTGTLTGAHLSTKMVDKVIVVVKAHDSRVGNGPFPTELPAHIANDEVLPYDEPYVGDVIREEAHEYGATTGRPRRVGWFDAVITKTSKDVLGADYLCVNHMDTLGEVGKKLGMVKMCTSYIYQGEKITHYPDDIRLTGEVPTPLYEEFKGGWTISRDTKRYKDIPKAAKKYIKRIEEVTGIPVKYIGIGPDNENLIVRDDVFSREKRLPIILMISGLLKKFQHLYRRV